MGKINHIGLIPDGTRRWADAHSIDLLSAYKITLNKISRFMNYSYKKAVNNLSIYMLSSENLKRKKEDFEPMVEAGIYYFNKILPDLCKKFKCRILNVGYLSILPKNLASAISLICQKSSVYSNCFLYLLIGYNPFDEINHALKTNQISKIYLKHLWVPKKIDFVIRTAGGPTILSNFLPLQCGYAQIYLIDKYFNDFTEKDFETIFNKAQKVKMLYGK